jgi:hypothetical protein
MGPCPVCGEPVALCDDKVIGLKDKLSGDSNSAENIQALARTVLEQINSQEDSADSQKTEKTLEERSGSETDMDPEVAPSIRNPAASPISADEVEDFLKIDLNLLGKKDFFDKHLR